jgi:peptidoglycan/LPS O-acetylase OafA/YrhL
MIQRIQTVFLVLAAACAFCTFAFPFATTEQTVQSSSIFNDGFYNVSDHVALMILFGLAGLLAIICVFVFKDRRLQHKLGIFAIIANALGIVLLILLLLQDDTKMDPDLINDGAGVYLPIAFMIFGLLALRFIRKDEELVRSIDRLR